MATQKEQQHKMNSFLWFLFVIIIPLIVAVVLAVIIFTAAGVDVVGWAKGVGENIPGISQLVSVDDTEEGSEDVDKLRTQLAEKEAEIDTLNRDIQALEATIEELEQEILKLENSAETGEETDGTEESKDNNVKTMAKSFKNMDPEQAALIFAQLESDLAISIMKTLSSDVRGAILEEMDAESAATLTQQFVDSQ
ncbi:MAG TPA: MotE family protein [Bacillota bacterium]|nr:MotE family protein [Bacillota bacterium]